MTRIARNFTFYCWAIKTTRKKQIENLNDYKTILERLEAAWVVGGVLADKVNERDGKGAIGVQGAERRVKRTKGDVIKIDFSVFKKKGGGFYQYYKRSMEELGLIDTMKNIPILTREGKSLANIFEENIKDTKYFKNFLHKIEIPKSVLLEYGQKSHFISLKKTTKEKNKLIDIFFKYDDNLDIPFSRKDTLTFILELVKLFESKNLILTDKNFRDIIFYKRTEKIDNYNPNNPNINRILSYWRFFVFHDYLTISLENILVCFIKETKRDSGISMNGFLDLYSKIINILSEYCGFDFSDKNLSNIIRNILRINGINDNLNATSSKKFDKKVSISSKFSEYNISKKVSESLSNEEYQKVVAFSILLLIILLIRFRHYIDKVDEEIIWIRNKCEGDTLDLFNIYDMVKTKINKLSLNSFLEFILDKIIYYHDLIAKEKLMSYGLDTKRFEKNGPSYHFKQDLEYSKRNSKFDAITSILEDLGLIVINDDNCKLTMEGKKILTNN